MDRREEQHDREPKKAKVSEDHHEGPAPPSRVVHVRNLPLDCTEPELRFLIPYPLQATQLLFLKGKGQAFIELKDIESSTQFIHYYATQPARVRGNQVYLQYSRRQELEVQNPTPSATTGGVVIHVTIIDCFYPVNVEILCSVFQYHGQILRIIIFPKKDQANNVGALIQYADPIAATAAKLTMNGKNLYEGCGILKIQDSNLKELSVEFNNERSWDFTRQLPSGTSKPLLGAKPSFMAGNSLGGFQGGGPLFHPGSPDFQSGVNSVLMVSNLNEQRVSPDILFALFSCYGDVQRVKILFNKRDSSLIQFTNSQQAATAMRMLNGVVLSGKPMNITLSNKSSIKMPQSGSEENSVAFNKDYTNSEFHRFKVIGSKNYQNISPPSPTLHVSNIPSPDEQKLRSLFSQYGHVAGFKFFPNNEKMALIQMGSVPEAVEALVALHLYPLTENTRIRVSFSKSSI